MFPNVVTGRFSGSVSFSSFPTAAREDELICSNKSVELLLYLSEVEAKTLEAREKFHLLVVNENWYA